MLRALPAGQIVLLDICQMVDLDAEGGELQPRDLAVDRLGDRVDARREGAGARDELLDGERVDRERDVHDGGRMTLAGGQVDHAAAREQVQPQGWVGTNYVLVH